MTENENVPTLTDIARQTYWEPGLTLEDHTIENALHEAGLNANDQKEKLRFISLSKRSIPLSYAR